MGAPYTELEKPLEDYSLVCRGCLAESGEMKDIFEWGFAEDFARFTNVVLTRGEVVSTLLCSKCEEVLLKFRQFRSQCGSSDMLLKSLAKRKSAMKSEVEAESTESGNYISYLLYPNKLVVLITAADDNSKLTFTCPHQCPDQFLKKSNLFYHLVKFHDVKKKSFEIELKYYCIYEDCSYNLHSDEDKSFTGRKFLNQHYNKVHKSKIFVCNICNHKFSTDTEYSRHLKACSKTFPCKNCGMVYHNNETLLVHLKRRHPDLHKQYKEENKAKKKAKKETETNKIRIESENLSEYICDSPKRSFATQTLKPEDNIKNDVALLPWISMSNKKDSYEAKTDEISTQTVFEDLLSIKSQNSEDDSIFFSETVSLSDIQTQTFPLEFGLSRSNKETITSETQSPDLSMKETQTCLCLYDSPKFNFRLFSDSIGSSPSSINLASAETQTSDLRCLVKSDKLLSSNSAETQTCFEDEDSKDSL